MIADVALVAAVVALGVIGVARDAPEPLAHEKEDAMAGEKLRELTPAQMRKGLANLDDQIAAAATAVEVAEERRAALTEDRVILEHLLALKMQQTAAAP